MKKNKKEKQPKFKYIFPKYSLSICPHCYSKMDKNSGICSKCGFRESSLDGATNALAKKAKSVFREDEVVKTKKLPPDVSYKKLILLVFLTGFAGGHLYYVGRYKKAIIYSVMALLSVLSMTYMMDVSVEVHGAEFALFTKLVFIACGIYIIDLFAEFGRVVFRRFKVPVLAPEKKENYDRSNFEVEPDIIK